MNAHVSRRGLVVASAAAMLPAVPAAASSTMMAAIDAHKWARARFEDADAEYVRLCAQLPKELPNVVVGHHRAVNEDTGEITITPRRAFTEDELARFFRLGRSELGSYYSPDEEVQVKARHDALLAELRECRAQRKGTEAALGLPAIEAEMDMAADVADAAFDALMQARPVTIDESRARADYLLALMEEWGPSGFPDHFLEEFLVSLATSRRTVRRTPAGFNLAWVKQMREDGFVFTCRGSADDVEAYAIEADHGQPHHTDDLIRILEARGGVS